MSGRFAQPLLAQLGSTPPAALMLEAISACLAAGHNAYGLQGDEIVADLREETEELVEAVTEGHSKQHIRNEIGDVLLALTALCRENDLTLEECLRQSVQRWLTRKALQEDIIFAAGHTWRTVPHALLEQSWKDVKTQLKQQEYQP